MSPQFRRLLWQGYRSQRALWLALTLCMLFFQGLFYVTMIEGSDSASEVFIGPIVATGMILVVCFLIASIVISFAGEDDQGTAIWLRLFPMSTSSLFGAKLLTAVIGSVGMASLGIVVALLVMTVHKTTGLAMTANDALQLSMLPFFLLAVSLFWSLWCRHVFQALGLVGASILLAGMFCQTIWGSTTGVRLVCIMLIAFATVPLIYRWRKGRFGGQSRVAAWPGTIATNWRLPGRRIVLWVGLPILTILVMGAFVRMALMSVPLVLLPIVIMAIAGVICLSLLSWYGWQLVRRELWPRLWMFWLTKSSTHSSQLSRTCSVLMWRECRLAVPSVLIAIACGIVALIGRVELSDVPWLMLLLPLVVIEFGLQTFRHDQQKEHGLFWSHRGVSPGLVLGIRTSVWLGALLVVATTWLVIDLPTRGPMFSHRHDRIIDCLAGVLLRASSAEAAVTNLSVPVYSMVPFASQALYALTWLIGGFAISQLCACWWRKPLIAFFMAAAGFTVFHVWLIFLIAYDVSLILCAWPIIAVMMMAVFRSRREWMDRRISVSIGCKRAAFVLIPLLCLWPARAAWRMLQVPRASGDLLAGHESTGNQQHATTGVWQKQWEDIHVSTQSLRGQRDNFESPVQLDPERLKQAEQAIAAIHPRYARRPFGDRPLPAKWKQPWSLYPAQPLAFAVMQLAEAQLQNDEPADALHQLVSGTAILRYLQKQATSWDQYLWSMELEQNLLQHIHYVAADDRLSEKQLTLAASEMATYVQSPILVRYMLSNRETVYWQILRRSGPLWEMQAPYVEDNALFSASYSERVRFLSLLFQSDQATVGVRDVPDSDDMRRWAKSTLTDNTDLLDDPVFSDYGSVLFPSPAFRSDGYLERQKRCRNAERATWLILRLQAWRRQHGAFPDRVEEMFSRPIKETPDDSESDPTPTSHVRDAQLLIDGEVWQKYGSLFAQCFRKSGLGYETASHGNAKVSRRVPGDQPVLWCTGYAVERQSERPNERTVDKKQRLKSNPNQIVYLDHSVNIPPVGDIERQEPDPALLHGEIPLEQNATAPVDANK